jgi:anti-anti-sigma factor
MQDNGVGRITVEGIGPTAWIVELAGEHDLSTVGGLQDELAAIFARGTTIVIDLSSVTFMDSSVLRELIVAQRRADSDDGEDFAIVAPPGGFAARLIALAGAGSVLSVHETRAAALSALQCS